MPTDRSTVSGDDSDGIIDRRKQRFDGGIPLCAELLPGRPEEGAIGGDVLQAVGDFAAAVRRAQHHHAAEPLRPVAGEIDPRQQPPHPMTDHRDPARAPAAKQLDGGMNLRQRLQRFAAAAPSWMFSTTVTRRLDSSGIDDQGPNAQQVFMREVLTEDVPRRAHVHTITHLL